VIVLVEDKNMDEMLVEKSRKEVSEDVLRDRIDVNRMKYGSMCVKFGFLERDLNPIPSKGITQSPLFFPIELRR